MVIEVLICSIGMASNRTSKSSSVLRSEEHTSELQSQSNLVCRLLLEKKKKTDELQSQSHPASYRLRAKARHKAQVTVNPRCTLVHQFAIPPHTLASLPQCLTSVVSAC